MVTGVEHVFILDSPVSYTDNFIFFFFRKKNWIHFSVFSSLEIGTYSNDKEDVLKKLLERKI
jgi:hypothetical protein